MNDDKQTTENSGFKIHKLPQGLHRQKTLSEEVEKIWGNCDRNIQIALSDIHGDRFYL